MTRASQILKNILGEAYSAPIPNPIGTSSQDSLVPNPEDARNHSNSMDIEDSNPLAKKIDCIIDSLPDDAISDELADIVEKYLETVDVTGEMPVYKAALMLPLEQCQDLYEELTSFLDDNDIDYSEDDTDADGMPTEVPADTYPSSAGMIMGPGSVAPSGSFSL